MNSSHFKILDRRQSCTGGPTSIYRAPLAAEITTTSVIAAIQVREALKVLCGHRDSCIHHVLIYDGMRNTMEVYEAEIDGRCAMHGELRNVHVAAGENSPSGME